MPTPWLGWGAAQSEDLVVLDRPSPEIRGQLLADAMRV